MQLRDWFFGLFGRGPRTEEDGLRTKDSATHVIILDGTMSSLQDGCETNAGLTYKLLQEAGKRANLTLHYEAGIQWRYWRNVWDVMTGRGINRQIVRAYGVLASRYRPGDNIILIGYSRGAYAVRSLAGAVDQVGLVRHDCATERATQLAYRHYRTGAQSAAAAAFRQTYCHEDVRIEAVAVWDTVKALGLRLPVIWRWSEGRHGFHNDALGRHIRHGFHALGLDETRVPYEPILWSTGPDTQTQVEQVWFRGNHGDVGGQVWAFPPARPLANIPLVWMLGNLESLGLPLPGGWQDRFPGDVTAPSVGGWRGWSKILLTRRKREVGRDRSERLHESVIGDGAPANGSLPQLHDQASGRTGGV